MIDGINVISQSPMAVKIGTTWGFSIWLCIGIVILVLGVYASFSKTAEKTKSTFLILILSAIVFGWSCHQKPVTETIYRYEVTISDDVTVPEFYNKYILLGRSGENTYIIRDRKPGEFVPYIHN